MLVSSKSTEKITVDEGVIFDYPMPNEEIGISRQILNGRCPVKGRYLNTKVDEIYIIVSGTATFHLENEIFDIGKDDVITVPPNTAHYLENAIDLQFITITRPNWYKEQYKTIK